MNYHDIEMMLMVVLLTYINASIVIAVRRKDSTDPDKQEKIVTDQKVHGRITGWVLYALIYLIVY